MAKSYTLDQIGQMMERILERLSPANTAEWVSGYDLRVKFGLSHKEIARYKNSGAMRTKPMTKNKFRLLYDISKVKHLLETDNKKSRKATTLTAYNS